MIINNVKYIYSDNKVIQDILKANEHSNNLALDALYNKFYDVMCKFIVTNSGSEDEAKDVFQEAIIILYENIKSRKFEQKSSIKTYLFSTIKHLWYNELKKKKNLQFTDANTDNLSDNQDFTIEDPADLNEQLIVLLDKMGGSCREILIMYYYKKLSMRDISMQLNFSSSESAKVQKNKCMNKLKNILESMNELKEDIQRNRYRIENF